MATNAFQYPFSRFYAEELKQSFGATSGNSFLLFFGRSVPWGEDFAGEPVSGSDVSPPSNANSIAERHGAWRNAIAAKILEPDDLYHVFRRIDWESGTKYDQYDDSVDLFDGTKDFYVLTDEMNVYKCISNNNGSASTSKPTGTSTSIFTTDNDLYKWKFMFKVTEDSKRFLTQEYIPCQFVTTKEVDETLPQYNVQVAAIEGAIEHLEMTGDNSATYTSSTSSTDSACLVKSLYSSNDADDDIERVKAADPEEYSGVDADDFNLSGSGWVKVDWPSALPGNEAVWYDGETGEGYAIYFHSGEGAEIGQLRQITDQITSYNGALLKLDSPLDVELVEGLTQYVINPHAVISGDGNDATMRLVTDAETDIIKEATTINRGTNYKNASVEIKTPPNGGTACGIIPSISPQGGHGANPIVDFNASKIMVVIKIDGTEDNDLLIGDDFRQFGIIKDATISAGGKSAGGVYYNEIAGSEFSKTINFELTHPHGNTTGWIYAQEEDEVTFKEGDYVYGSESRATAQVKSWRKKVGGNESQEIGILEIDDMVGGFDIPTGKTDELRYVFTDGPYVGIEANVQPTDIVTQSLDFADGNSAEGTVISYNSDENELLVKLVTGSFGKTGEVWVNRSSSGSSVGFTSEANITLFENKGGELLKSFTDTNSVVDFRMYGITQDIARARTQTEILSLYDRIPTYNLMHKFIITDSDSDMNISTFTNASNLEQLKSDSETATATVSKWNMVGDGSTGEMYVTNVFNTFESTADGFSGDFTTSGVVDATKTITSIQIPELNMGSGELLYIQNIRPISRTFDQQEEFKILLGF